MWASSNRGRGSRESEQGSSNLAGARLRLHSQVLIPNSRCQKLLLQRLTNKSFISGYLRKWRVLTCPGGGRLKASKSDARLLPAICWGVDFSLLTPPGGQRDLMYTVAHFYLFHEKIIYILMPEPEVEYNFERTTPNRHCNINGRCCSSGTSADSWKSERLRSEVTTHGYDRKPPFRLSGASDSVPASKLPLPPDPRCYMGADEHQQGCSAFNKPGPGRWEPVQWQPSSKETLRMGGDTRVKMKMRPRWEKDKHHQWRHESFKTLSAVWLWAANKAALPRCNGGRIHLTQ